MKLPSVKDLPVAGKKVIVRGDLDVPLDKISRKDGRIAYKVIDDTRIKQAYPTIKCLLDNWAKIVVIIGHIGRPVGKDGISTFFIWPVVSSLAEGASYWPEIPHELGLYPEDEGRVALLENLRFWPGEETNDPRFAQKLASLGDFYVNEAFAASHRKHASIVGIPKFLPSAFGLHFLEEVEVLEKVRNNPVRPLTLILGGAKADKLEGVEKLAKWADWILVGGKLPKLIANYQTLPTGRQVDKLRIAKLNAEGKDISNQSIEEFRKIILQSRMVVWAGPVGVYEEEKNASGTREVAQAIVDSGAFSVVGGGDTEAALKQLGFDGKMSYISSGGGAMLEFLANGTLPGIEAIKHGQSSH